MISNDFYKFVLNGVKDGVYFVNTKRQITFWNKSAERITGFKQGDVLDHFCFDNILNHVDGDGCALCKDGCPLHLTLKDGIERHSKVYLHHKDGHRVESNIFVMPIMDNGEIIGAVETFSDDIDEVQNNKAIEELKSLAYYDQLTGLANRRYIDDQLAIQLQKYQKMNMSFAVAILDVDHFKNFNDNYGHDVGDLVLKMLAKVFNGATRGDDFIGRWGGEEFIAVFRHIEKDQLEDTLNRIRMLVENSSLRLEEASLKVTISIGGSMVNKTDTIESIIKRVDKNLYKSKDNGRNQVTIS